jgi:uncharacterized protein
MGLPHFEPPRDDDVAAPFWEGIDSEVVMLPRCSHCGRWQWYPDEAGADCPGATLVWEEVVPRGVIHTATRVERAFLPGGQADVPYVVAFVELDGVDGVRLVANVPDDVDVAIGDRVHASFVDFGDRKQLVFVPDHAHGAGARSAHDAEVDKGELLVDHVDITS